MKTVRMPIEVPAGEYCYGPEGGCPQYDNEGGTSECTLGFNIFKYPCKFPVDKANECKELEE